MAKKLNWEISWRFDLCIKLLIVYKYCSAIVVYKYYSAIVVFIFCNLFVYVFYNFFTFIYVTFISLVDLKVHLLYLNLLCFYEKLFHGVVLNTFHYRELLYYKHGILSLPLHEFFAKYTQK